MKQTRMLKGDERVCCIMDRFHIVGSSENHMKRTIKYLKELKADIVSPIHCSEFEFTLEAATEPVDCFASNRIET